MLEELKTKLEARLEASSLGRWALGGATAGMLGLFAVATAPAAAAVGAAAAAGGGTGAFVGAYNALAGREIYKLKIEEVHRDISRDRMEGKKLKEMIEVDALGKCVADFAVFCRAHIDSVLSSKLLEDEFGFLLDVLRGTRSYVAAEPQPTLVPKEVNFDFDLVKTLLERLRRLETPEITRQILNELQECPGDGEIRTRITDFTAKKFAGACASQK